jgi:hypothetical protein
VEKFATSLLTNNSYRYLYVGYEEENGDMLATMFYNLQVDYDKKMQKFFLLDAEEIKQMIQ